VVIAESYERIHRSNLVGMGVLPLQFLEGEGREKLALSGKEKLSIKGLSKLHPKQRITVEIIDKNGKRHFDAIARLDTEVDVEYYGNGGILQTVLKNMLAKGKAN